MSKTISAMIIAILVVSAVAIGIGDYNMNLALTYGMKLNKTESIKGIGKLKEMNANLQEINEQLQKDLENPISVFLSAPITAIKGVILYIQILTESNAIFTGFSELAPLPLPFWIFTLITSIFVVIIITFLISRIARGGEM